MRGGITSYFKVLDKDLNEITQTYNTWGAARNYVKARCKGRRPPGRLLKSEFGYMYVEASAEGIPFTHFYFVRTQLDRVKRNLPEGAVRRGEKV